MRHQKAEPFGGLTAKPFDHLGGGCRHGKGRRLPRPKRAKVATAVFFSCRFEGG
jgi:hypothetical protein